MPRQLFLEKVVALEAGAKAIEGLAGFPDPEANSVEGSAKRTHLLLVRVLFTWIPELGVLALGFRDWEFAERKKRVKKKRVGRLESTKLL